MTSRARQVLALLRSADSWIPGPSVWKGNPLSWRADSGEAPSKSVRCSSCGGEGWIGKTTTATKRS